MTVFIGVILFVVLMGAIGYGYYLDYKRDKKNFVLDVKSVLIKLSWWIGAFIIWMGIERASETLLPVHSDYGKEFNEKREELGIPAMPDHWNQLTFISRQYSKWYGPERKDTITGHYKKYIEFNYWHATLEEDYYQNTKTGDNLVARYDYGEESHRYYLIRTSGAFDISLVSGTIDDTNGTLITKDRFDQILNSWTRSDAILEKEENE